MVTLEKELKLLLEQDSYNIFLSYFNSSTYSVHQINYYFDTIDFTLNNLGITLRIRRENQDNWLLCLKMKIDNMINSFVSSQEIERQISETDFIATQNDPNQILNFFEDELPVSIKSKLHSTQLRCLGAIENQRQKLNLSEKYICELDRTLYPGGHEYYEMEFEGVRNDEDCKIIIEKLEEMGLEFKVNKKSKYKRFVELCNANN